MPFESKAQQRFMFAKHPEMAKEWADKDARYFLDYQSMLKRWRKVARPLAILPN